MAKAKPKGVEPDLAGFQIPILSKGTHPGQRNASPKDGPGRGALDYADGNRMIHDFGSPAGYPAQSPASARYTPGLRSNPTKGENDPAALTIQPGIPSVR